MKKSSNLLGKNCLSPIRYMRRVVIYVLVFIILTVCGKDVNSEQSKNLDSKGQILLLESEANSASLNVEELGNIQKIIESGTWNEETAECIDDCLISIEGMDYYYHRECGTINDNIHRRHMNLNNEDKEMLIV